MKRIEKPYLPNKVETQTGNEIIVAVAGHPLRMIPKSNDCLDHWYHFAATVIRKITIIYTIEPKANGEENENHIPL